MNIRVTSRSGSSGSDLRSLCMLFFGSVKKMTSSLHHRDCCSSSLPFQCGVGLGCDRQQGPSRMPLCPPEWLTRRAQPCPRPVLFGGVEERSLFWDKISGCEHGIPPLAMQRRTSVELCNRTRHQIGTIQHASTPTSAHYCWPLQILTLAGKSHIVVPGVTSLKGAPNQLVVF